MESESKYVYVTIGDEIYEVEIVDNDYIYINDGEGYEVFNCSANGDLTDAEYKLFETIRQKAFEIIQKEETKCVD